MTNTETIFNKDEVVNFIKAYYYEETNKIISPIKLQKTLYFLFAYWGGFVEYAKNNSNEAETSYPEYLFEPSFEAWGFGPVDNAVYKDFRENKSYNKELFEKFFDGVDSIVEEFFMDYIMKCFNTGDFSLVERSHQDLCWKNHYHEENPYHNELIPAEEIIKEYAKNF